jgi:hypothetical protein
MAIQNNVFVNCNDSTNTVVLQYNDIFFVPGTIASYQGGCWIDSGDASGLIPVADVTFENYETCESCITNTQVGILLGNCTSITEYAEVTFQIDDAPPFGSVVLYNGECWDVISEVSPNLNISAALNSYESCDICQTFAGMEEGGYERALFVNCCDNSDTKIFNIIPTNFGFPLGTSVIYNNKCYNYVSLSPSGTIVGSFAFPQYYDCKTCSESNPCPTPTPTPSVTPTISVTPTVTPTVSLSSSVTPTPTKTPFLSPSVSPTTTTTTRPLFRNECEPITLFPLGVTCESVDPSTPNSTDGSVTIFITGGTAPYSIVWSTGAVNTTTLTNLQTGSYTAFVIDYYGDFSAQTTCNIVAPSPTPTPTVTPTMTPSPSSIPFGDLCLTINVDGQLYQFEFNFYTIINGKPAWSASTTNTPVTNGTPLIMNWTLPGLSVGPTLGPEYRVTGWVNSMWYLSSTTNSVPPLSGWGVIGSSPNVSVVSVTNGPCPIYTDLELSISSNNTTCATSNDGSICVTVNGGSGIYEYSIDGVNYGSSNCFFNLSPGNYTVYVIDLIDPLTPIAQNVIIGSLGLNTNITLGYTLVSSTNNIVSPNILQNTKVYTFNNGSIPNGVTLNLSFLLSNLLKVYEPGDGNNVGSTFIIEKNGTPITLTTGTVSNSISNRPGCNPYKINSTETPSSGSMSVINTDTITVTIINRVTVTDPMTDGCITRIESDMSVNTSFTYSGVQNCVELQSGNVNITSSVSRNLGFS